MQTTSHILMIRPVQFGYNPETAVNNAFQTPGHEPDIADRALAEFDRFVDLLRAQGVDVTVVQDSPEPPTPDSIFPNNWVSFHEDGTVVLYPMFAVNRRRERKPAVLAEVARRFEVRNTRDLSGYEGRDMYLEGTGSMVLDRDHRIAYACLSARTGKEVLEDWCRQLGYRAVLFEATDAQGQAIYHTNVLMCVGDRFVLVCLEAVRQLPQRRALEDTIRQSGKEIIPISLDQMAHFAGNLLQVENHRGEKLLVMSSQAFGSLEPGQVARLNKYGRIVHSPLEVIEQNGGGSARCMMAEIYLPERLPSTDPSAK
ncbi:MAG TPA: arginine deiminase-related protein [Chitinophagaceae bacterium]|nr:arginine deiminase-related protein [Chitinophagaceae bacterium]